MTSAVGKISQQPYVQCTNGLLMGNSSSGNLAIITATAPATANRTLNIYDAGASCDVELGVQHVVPVTATGTTLASSQSGCIVSVANAGSAYNIQLPAPYLGANYKFIVLSALNAAVTLKSSGANVLGSVLSSDGTAVTGGNVTTAKTNVILGTTAAIGDIYEYFSADGTNYHLRGITAVHGSVTFS